MEKAVGCEAVRQKIGDGSGERAGLKSAPACVKLIILESDSCGIDGGNDNIQQRLLGSSRSVCPFVPIPSRCRCRHGSAHNQVVTTGG